MPGCHTSLGVIELVMLFLGLQEKVIHVVDPMYKEEESAYCKKLHGPIVDKIGAELANCIDMFF